ncbi:MAG: S8 family serine peptidase [Bryobacterales bacterium]|nr:S8 family serine peptidase [Bryobacterales bacterium]
MRFPGWGAIALAAGTLLAAAQPRSGKYAVILEDEPVGPHMAGKAGPRSAAAAEYRGRVLASQAEVRGEIERRNLRVTGSVNTLLNAVFVQASPDRAAELRGVPGVKAVVPLHTFRMHLNKAVELENVPAAWQALGGTANAGAGVKIAIIDSGIDQAHLAFQDPSLSVPAGYPKCAGADCAFTNNKVIVARSYIPLVAAGSPPNPAADSRPDDNSPRDRVGHGTALAMIAAGFTNAGPAATITGMAPRAWLGSYKIFGSPGVNDSTSGDAIIRALEDAVNDGMDVAVLSLGSPAFTGPLDQGASCGQTGSTPCDPEAAAVEAASKAGMLVVVSAGNDGDAGTNLPTLGTVASPATAPSALAVGASTNSHVFISTVRVSGTNLPSGLQSIPAVFGDGPSPASPVTAPVLDVAPIDGTGNACAPLPSGSLSGAFALILRTPGGCSFLTKVAYAQNAGAAGVIFVQVAGSDSILTPGGLTGTSIPSAMIGSAAGAALKGYLPSHPGLQATLDPSLSAFNVSTFNAVAEFSSHGPSITGLLKPELVAVGTDVYMATQRYDPSGEMFDPSGYIAAQGTSFSAPMAAGVAALAKQKNPGFTAAQLKSAVVNSATQDVAEGSALAGVLASGNGKLNAGGAIAATVTADPATISFGMLDRSSALPLERTLTLHYGGIGQAALSLRVVAADVSQRAPTLDRTELTLTAQDQTLRLTLSGSLPSPGIYQGVVEIQGGGAVCRVPYLYVVGDGVPNDVIALTGAGFDAVAGDYIPGGIAFRVIDRYGAPVKGLAVQFRVIRGGGVVRNADSRTDQYGIAGADAILGSALGTQQFAAVAGNLTVPFAGNARARPAISSNGIVNAASFRSGPVAPGSYISIFGRGLSDISGVESTAYLPLSLAGVSVSFDVPSAGLSVPGRIIFVSPSQVNVQVPWELRGQTSAQVKVSIGYTSGQLYTVQVADYSPAVYADRNNGAAALNESNAVISSGVPALRGHVVQLYVNGLGPVNNQPATGDPAPSATLSRTLATPSVSIGGRPAAVSFSGLAPGFPGLNQVNFVVPADTPAGAQQVVVTIGGLAAPPVTLPVQ